MAVGSPYQSKYQEEIEEEKKIPLWDMARRVGFKTLQIVK